ncbi:modifier of mdg4-like isoform X8 [Contarinia nasturtii]|uniref:modifier of mdg4-like isoform X8 n=1 Tax=Contarinia nasturtii TaxID=265458 RepID=UPI0012D3CC4C|nr:modifier of mdg4-like isoform X8 [Contarinia nasturtii]
MADGEEEQFSLCWNNYNTNLSTGFHESLVRGDLVDVTLAAEGQLVKAHRLVLSVCSPYFQQMFTTMPANQHAFVFLKDVPHAALKDLIQFMYCGEVNVKQDALPTFISTAEALQIKGLTENGDTQSAPVQMPSTQTHVPIKQATSTPVVQSQQRPRTVQQRNVSRSYKLDSEDSSDDKAATIMVSQKRVLPRSAVSAPASAKRIKTISSDPLEQPETSRVVQSAQQGTSTQIVQVTSAADVGKGVGEPEFIDLPIETIPTKAEPDYGDDGDVEQADDAEATYVEDESYGDMKYDESYFTEGEDTTKGASASGFGDSYNEGDTSANEAQGVNDEYLCYEENLLPEFPFTQPAAFQIFESDCKINPSLVEQLRYKFSDYQNTNAEEFINENLSQMLTRTAASVYSWAGTQGYHPLSKFKSMKVLIECATEICGIATKDATAIIRDWFNNIKK